MRIFRNTMQIGPVEFLCYLYQSDGDLDRAIEERRLAIRNHRSSGFMYECPIPRPNKVLSTTCFALYEIEIALCDVVIAGQDIEAPQEQVMNLLQSGNTSLFLKTIDPIGTVVGIQNIKRLELREVRLDSKLMHIIFKPMLIENVDFER